ncbi:MAG TPA: amidohydrolase family protein [Acidimicrobiia bacterium]|jgi:N-acyl-D-aspartate/D-glutamate deacylase|nr:amidohydrolase family protein [Acidimicrobiia bacterium]
MYDVKITNGIVVDGTGDTRFVGDVAVKDGAIVEVSRSPLPGEAAETIDATGLLVTPGFVDVHTHYDGQATWDPLLEPSSGHGVTTVVAGNCGVGFAPVRPGDEKWLISLMEGVEDIPGTALTEGIDWSWETFPEYLDALDRRRFGIDVGVQVSHGAVRAYAMGERGAANVPATPEEIAAMAAIVQDAVEAGALGFSTSRTLGHRAMDGRPVPGTFAAEDELFALGGAMRRAGGGVFELAPLGASGEDLLAPQQEMAWMRRLSEALDLPVSFTLLQIDAAPDAWRGLMDESLRAHDDGAQVVPQVAARPFGMLLGFPTRHGFSGRPTYRELAARLSPEELLVELARPAVRAQILAEPDVEPDPTVLFDGMFQLVQASLDRLYALGDPPVYEPTPDRTVAAMAAEAGVEPITMLYDVMLEHGAQHLLMLPFFNYAERNHDAIREMLLHPAAVSGLSDGGAHCGLICDASIPTFMLTHWARDRTRGDTLPLEYLVKKQTSDTAALFGLGDRGVLAPGKKADVNVVDFEHLSLSMPRLAHDLPAGGGRLLQDAHGYVATMVGGEVTRRHGLDTGARPGRLVRGPR